MSRRGRFFAIRSTMAEYRVKGFCVGNNVIHKPECEILDQEKNYMVYHGIHELVEIPEYEKLSWCEVCCKRQKQKWRK